MPKSAALTIGFIERRPLSAARALSSIDPADAAALLDTIPSRFIARVFSHMGTWQASSILRRMQPASAAAALREINYAEAAIILRLLPPDLRSRTLDEMPHKLRRDFNISLTFPDDTIGAHMSPDVLLLQPDHTVGDATTQFRFAPNEDTDEIFLVDKTGQLSGAGKISLLLRHPEETPLGDICDAVISPLSARARLSSVAGLEEWDEWTQLPVTNRHRQIIGALPRKIACRASHTHGSSSASAQHSLTVSIAEAIFITGLSLAEVLIDFNLLATHSHHEVTDDDG